MEFPRTFAVTLLRDDKAEKYADIWRAQPRLRERWGRDWPFREHVEVGLVEPDLCHKLRVREGEVYAIPEWDNIGYFMRSIESARQIEIVLSLLHTDWMTERLTPEQIRRIRQRLDSDPGAALFKIHRPDFDRVVPPMPCFLKDGIWYAHFAMIDGANLTEYKYAFNSASRVARVWHTMVEGAPPPPAIWLGRIKSRSVVKGSLDGQHVETVEYEPVHEEEKEAYRRRHMHCVNWFAAALHLPAWRKALADSDPTARRNAADAIGDLGDVANDAIPDLVKLLKDTDRDVRRASAVALGRIGPIALPELRKLLQSPDADVFHLGAMAVREMGPAAKDVVPDLGRALRDERGSREFPLICGALQAIGVPAVPELRRTLRDGNENIRWAAAEALGFIGPGAKEAIPDLRKLSKEEPNPRVRAVAEKAIQLIEK